MFITLLLLCVTVEVFSTPEEILNKTMANSPKSFSRLGAARQYGPPPLQQSQPESFTGQVFKPADGYIYPNPTNQKLQFSHDNKLHIYLFQNKLSLYCATDTTYERITWRKYSCPSHIGTQNGETVAVGPMVFNPHLYGVNSFGRNEEYVSELLLKQPLISASDGAYVCEGVFLSDKYPHEGLTTVRDIIIIGGKGMYQNCFNQVGKISARRVSNITNFGF